MGYAFKDVLFPAPSLSPCSLTARELCSTILLCHDAAASLWPIDKRNDHKSDRELKLGNEVHLVTKTLCHRASNGSDIKMTKVAASDIPQYT